MPTNRSDPDLVHWTKYKGNPVISVKTGALPGRDPTTAWWSETLGAWRMAYGTTEGANVYTSTDFLSWTHVGLLNQVGHGSALVDKPLKNYKRPGGRLVTAGGGARQHAGW